jgi:hypothetical protein
LGLYRYFFNLSRLTNGDECGIAVAHGSRFFAPLTGQFNATNACFSFNFQTILKLIFGMWTGVNVDTTREHISFAVRLGKVFGFRPNAFIYFKGGRDGVHGTGTASKKCSNLDF